MLSFQHHSGIGPGVQRRDPEDVQQSILGRLTEPLAYPHPVAKIRRLETHISYIFLTGRFAYKIKKAVNLGFLDFTELERRQFFCHEELRLNRRLAPKLYLGVVPIADVPGTVCIGSQAPAVEYAVKMLQFPQSALLDCCLAEQRLTAGQINVLADRVAAFHLGLPHSAPGDEYGSPLAIWESLNGNLMRLRSLLRELGSDASATLSLDQLEHWSRLEYGRLKGVMTERRMQGFVRECHGDLHLGNIAWWLDEPQIFDCIEFSPSLRWIDVINEIAFTNMDFSAHERFDLAWRFINRYLENTGDYSGLKILPFYEVYRAMVRAMVAGIRGVQEDPARLPEYKARSNRYLALAIYASLPRKRMLVLMHGFSGAGKTAASQALLEAIGAIRVRSDVERKRLFGLAPTERSRSEFGVGVYADDNTRATYQHLVKLARQVLDAGFPVVVDAASLKAWQREIFRNEARTQGLPFRIVSCSGAEQTLYERILRREEMGNDASDADPSVLHHQVNNCDPLTLAEQKECLFVDENEGALSKVLCCLKEEVGV